MYRLVLLGPNILHNLAKFKPSFKRKSIDKYGMDLPQIVIDAKSKKKLMQAGTNDNLCHMD